MTGTDNPINASIHHNLAAASKLARDIADTLAEAASVAADPSRTNEAIGGALRAVEDLRMTRQLTDAAITLNRLRQP